MALLYKYTILYLTDIYIAANLFATINKAAMNTFVNLIFMCTLRNLFEWAIGRNENAGSKCMCAFRILSDSTNLLSKEVAPIYNFTSNV